LQQPSSLAAISLPWATRTSSNAQASEFCDASIAATTNTPRSADDRRSRLNSVIGAWRLDMPADYAWESALRGNPATHQLCDTSRLALVSHPSPIEADARIHTIRRHMNTKRARQKWFTCFCPDGLISRRDAVDLILKHAAKARVVEDPEGGPALMVGNNGGRRMVLFSDLTDAEIRVELPTAWLREHQQRDMFRDAAEVVANDENCPPVRSVWETIKDAFGALLR
jgi:hypothetical protein